MSIAELKQQIADNELLIDSTVRTLESSRLRLKEIEGERKAHVVPARTHKDAKAQEQLKALDEERKAALTSVQDDEQALEQLTSELEDLRRDLQIAVWENARGLVRDAVRARLDSGLEGDLESAVAKVVRICKDLDATDAAVAAAVHQFEPKLHDAAREIGDARHRRADLVACALKDVVPIAISSGYMDLIGRRTPAMLARELFERVLNRLDRLRLAA